MPKYYSDTVVVNLIKAYTIGDWLKQTAMLESLSNSQVADVVDCEEYNKMKKERDMAISYGNDMSWGCVAKEYEGW